MSEKKILKPILNELRENFLEYLAKEYPVMCSSDEFYFFPRARTAVKFLNRLDSLDQEKIKENISYIKNLKLYTEELKKTSLELEDFIDVTLLQNNISSFLREFEEIKIWEIDPTLYLKIALLGSTQILTRISLIKMAFGENLKSRLAQIPRLLQEAKENLKTIPLEYLEEALEIIASLIEYLKGLKLNLRNSSLKKEINSLVKKALWSLENFRDFLIKSKLSPLSFLQDKKILKKILKESYSYEKEPEELFEIARKEHQDILQRLKNLAKKIKPQTSWQEILTHYILPVKNTEELLELYSSQIQKLKSLLKEKQVLTLPRTQNVLIKLTPAFLKPLRVSASYSSTLTLQLSEPAYFYISIEEGFSKRSLKKFTPESLHNEYIYVTAHETYPGHHLLDTIRKQLKNPLRAQTESPLFYEGWASYAEELIEELGYIENPLQRLIGLKRQGWRAVRAMIDTGLRTGQLKISEARNYLLNLGYEPQKVERMLRHYLLMPGYHLSYTVGKLEIKKLREKFLPSLGWKKFHDLLLNSGQIPFSLLERRFTKACLKNL